MGALGAILQQAAQETVPVSHQHQHAPHVHVIGPVSVRCVQICFGKEERASQQAQYLKANTQGV